MALIKCPECSKEISSHSDKCINCGYPINTNNDTKNTTPHSTYVNARKKNSLFFSNKANANNMMTIMYCVCIPLLVLQLFLESPISYILCAVVIIVALCMGPLISYVEICGDTISGRPKNGKKFSIKISAITNVTRGEHEITIYTNREKYTVNCGDKCETIIAYISNIKEL